MKRKKLFLEFYSSYFILINWELYGVKSKFHIHGIFVFRLDFFLVSIRLDERLIVDNRLPVESRVIDAVSAFPEEEFPPVRRETKD